MKPAENQAAGGHFGFPNPCPTVVGPATPALPYASVSLNAMSAPSSRNVLITGAPALNMMSRRLLTMGDNPAIPGTNMKEEDCIAGSENTFTNGAPATTLGTPTTGNGGNCVGLKAMPSVTNTFINHPGAVFDAEGFAGLLPRDGSAVEARMLPGGLGLVRVAFLSRDVPARVHTAIARLSSEGMSALVMDLRDNPGGELDPFLELAGDFLEPGSVLVRMWDAEGDETVYRAQRPDPHRFPLVVLVNRGTASAAELLAGCLQAHGRAVVAGERTYGKGTGRALAAGAGPSAVFEHAVFTLPDGAAVDGCGVTPDVAAPSPLPEHVITDGAELRDDVR